MAVRLCTHIQTSAYKQDHRGYYLSAGQSVDVLAFKYYLSCKECAVLTPTLESRIPGTLRALAKLVGYTILRPFAALIALAIRADIDSIKHPTKARIGRILTIPFNYVKYEWAYLKGYVFWGNAGKAQIILAQAKHAQLRQYIYTEDAGHVTEIFHPPFRDGTKICPGKDREKERLRILRHGNMSFTLRNLSFRDLIDQGYLVLSNK